MADQEVGLILQGLIAGQQRRNQEAQLIQRRQEAFTQSEERKAQLDELKKQHDVENKRQDLALKASLAMQKLQQMKMQADFAGMPIQQLQAIPGATTSPITTTQQESDSSEVGQTFQQTDPNNVLLQLPGLAQMVHPTAQAQLASSQAAEEAKLAPHVAGQLKVLEAGKKADLERFQMQKDEDFARAAMQKQMDDERARLLRESQERIALGNQAARRYAADHKTGELFDETLILPHVKDILNGDLSLEDFNRLPIGKGNKLAIVHGVTEAKGAIPTKKQLESVTKYAPLIGMFPKMDEYNQLIKEHPYAVQIPANDYYRRAKALEQELDIAVPNVARTIASESGRLSNFDIQLVKAGSQPSKNLFSSDYKTNVTKRDDLRETVENAIKAQLSNLPEFQRNAIIQKSGLNSIPYVGRKGANSSPKILKFDSQGNKVE